MIVGQYSFGMTCYEDLLGKRAFPDPWGPPTVEEILKALAGGGG